MGNIIIEVGDLRDLITEEVGCKSGLLLTDNEAGLILGRADHDEAALFEGDREGSVRMRPEEIEDVVVQLRYRVGGLPDPSSPIAGRINWSVSLNKQGIDVGPIYKAFETVVRSGKYKVLGEQAAAEMIELSQMPEILVYEFLMHTGNQLDRSLSWFHARTVDIGWAIPLVDLFQTETIPNDPELYLDQRYIDYFVHNGEDLARMHWRNFERLTTEFFRRKGFEVLLGPGSRDGGIDVRIWPAGGDQSGPPLIIVQCKRYSEGYDVGVETVKAFWSDILYEGAQHGLIATTSRVSPEGVKLSRARQWPLGFIQNKQVTHWVKTMWRHSPIASTESGPR